MSQASTEVCLKGWYEFTLSGASDKYYVHYPLPDVSKDHKIAGPNGWVDSSPVLTGDPKGSLQWSATVGEQEAKIVCQKRRGWEVQIVGTVLSSMFRDPVAAAPVSDEDSAKLKEWVLADGSNPDEVPMRAVLQKHLRRRVGCQNGWYALYYQGSSSGGLQMGYVYYGIKDHHLLDEFPRLERFRSPLIARKSHSSSGGSTDNLGGGQKVWAEAEMGGGRDFTWDSDSASAAMELSCGERRVDVLDILLRAGEERKSEQAKAFGSKQFSPARWVPQGQQQKLTQWALTEFPAGIDQKTQELNKLDSFEKLETALIWAAGRSTVVNDREKALRDWLLVESQTSKVMKPDYADLLKLSTATTVVTDLMFVSQDDISGAYQAVVKKLWAWPNDDAKKLAVTKEFLKPYCAVMEAKKLVGSWLLEGELGLCPGRAAERAFADNASKCPKGWYEDDPDAMYPRYVYYGLEGEVFYDSSIKSYRSPMIYQSNRWMPDHSDPGPEFDLYWDNTYADVELKCKGATRNGYVVEIIHDSWTARLSVWKATYVGTYPVHGRRYQLADYLKYWVQQQENKSEHKDCDVIDNDNPSDSMLCRLIRHFYVWKEDKMKLDWTWEGRKLSEPKGSCDGPRWRVDGSPVWHALYLNREELREASDTYYYVLYDGFETDDGDFKGRIVRRADRPGGTGRFVLSIGKNKFSVGSGDSIERLSVKCKRDLVWEDVLLPQNPSRFGAFYFTATSSAWEILNTYLNDWKDRQPQDLFP